MTFVKQIGGAAALGVAMLIGCGLSAPPAQAGYIVTLEQVGSNVVATGSGTIDLAGLSLNTSPFADAGMNPMHGVIRTGPTSGAQIDIYTLVTGPTSFGSGGGNFFIPASSGSGDMVAISGIDDTLNVPHGYVSGSALADSSTYNNQTFGSLGVTPGQYRWTWGSGADSFTLDIGVAAVPAPLIGRGLPSLLAAGGLLFGAKLLERSKRHRLQFG